MDGGAANEVTDVLSVGALFRGLERIIELATLVGTVALRSP